MTNVLTLYAHPNPNSLSWHLLDTYSKAAADAGAQVRRLELARLDFDPILRSPDPREQPLEPDLRRAQADILWAQHLVFAFPLWWSSTPALLKGFIDRTFLSGFAYRYPEGGGLPEKLLTGRSARVISSMDSPRFWNVLMQGRSLHHAFTRSTLGFVGFSPLRESILYRARERSRQDIERFAAGLAKAARKDVARWAGQAAGQVRGALP